MTHSQAQATTYKPRRPAGLTNRALMIAAGLLVLAVGVVALATSRKVTDPWMVWPPVLLLLVAAALCVWPTGRAARAASPASPMTAPRRLFGKSASGALSPADHSAWMDLSHQATQFFEKRGLSAPPDAAPWMPQTDRWLHKGPRKYLIQARYWQATAVDVPEVQALLKTMKRQGASGGVLVCGADVFTPAARTVARSNAIMLLEPLMWRAATPRRSAPMPMPRAASAPRAPTATSLAHAAATSKPPGPVLRPDHEVPVRRDFAPTQPLSSAERARLELKDTLTTQSRALASASRPMPPQDFPSTEPITPTELAGLTALMSTAPSTPRRG